MAKTRVVAGVIFDDAELQKIIKRLRGELAKAEVGIMEGEIAAYGMVHEFGSPARNIPERSFLRSTVNENEAEYQKIMTDGLGLIIDGTKTMRPVLVGLARRVQKDVKRKIRSGPFAPLQESTVAAKGSSKPLIDTGALRSAIVWRVDSDASDLDED